MKCRLFITVLLAGLLSACGHNSSSSRYETFTVNSSSGSHEVGVYLPEGYSGENSYPVIYSTEKESFEQENYKQMLDSLINGGLTCPVIVALTTMPEGTDPVRPSEAVLDFMATEFVQAVEDRYSVGHEFEDRHFYGLKEGADFALVMASRRPDAMEDYWCLSPSRANWSAFPLLPHRLHFRLGWDSKDDTETTILYAQELIMSIKKRGGVVFNWTFYGAGDKERWKNQFIQQVFLKFQITPTPASL